MKARDFWRSQFRRKSWIRTDARVLTCTAASDLWTDDYEWLGVSHYYIRVCYLASDREILTEFRWSAPWAEGDTLSLRYDPANPDCNDRTGIWFLRMVLFWVVLGLIATVVILAKVDWGLG